jgi:hypothetical protein
MGVLGHDDLTVASGSDGNRSGAFRRGTPPIRPPRKTDLTGQVILFPY